MKSIVIIYLSLLILVHGAEPIPTIDTAKNVIIRMSSQGEDATSTFYTFAYSLEMEGTEHLYKLRCLWNGGASNPPNTRDYYMKDDGSVMKVDRSYTRNDLEALLVGKSPDGKVTKRISFNVNGKLNEVERKELTMLYHWMRTSRGMKLLKQTKIEQVKD